MKKIAERLRLIETITKDTNGQVDEKLVFNTSLFDGIKLNQANVAAPLKQRQKEIDTEATAIDDIRSELQQMIDAPKKREAYEKRLTDAENGLNYDESKDASSELQREAIYYRAEVNRNISDILGKCKEDLMEYGLEDVIFNGKIVYYMKKHVIHCTIYGMKHMYG